MLVIAVLLASWVMTRFVNKKPLGAIGVGFHHRTGREFVLGCLLGFLMMAGVFLVQWGLGYLSFSSLGLSTGQIAARVVLSAFFFLFAAAGEELMFRGYFFQTLMQAITFLPAAVLMSLLFGMAHLANPHVTAFGAINVALAGLWLSFAYLKTRSLWFPIGIHVSWNFCQTVVFGFPTSGQEFQARRLFETTVIWAGMDYRRSLWPGGRHPGNRCIDHLLVVHSEVVDDRQAGRYCHPRFPRGPGPAPGCEGAVSV